MDLNVIVNVFCDYHLAIILIFAVMRDAEKFSSRNVSMILLNDT